MGICMAFQRLQGEDVATELALGPRVHVLPLAGRLSNALWLTKQGCRVKVCILCDEEQLHPDSDFPIYPSPSDKMTQNVEHEEERKCKVPGIWNVVTPEM